jgi:putative oxidoreductase
MHNRNTDTALLLLRLVVGVVFFAHGAQKVLGLFGGHGLQGTVAAMTKMGFPVIVPYLVSFGELLAGLGLIFGILSRIAAAGMFLEMLGAVLLVHWKNGFFGDKMGFEYPLTLCIVCLAILIAGPGRFAVTKRF